jgi:hypothetical protein
MKASARIKKAHRAEAPNVSLKKWARDIAKGAHEGQRELAKQWLKNKRDQA